MKFDPKIFEELINTFKSELEEQTQVITSGLLALEEGNLQDENYDKTMMNIFRCAHNIKGTSRSLGINDIGEIAHYLESIFQALQKKTIPVNFELIDLCLEAVDKMQMAMHSFMAKTPLSFDLKALLVQLENSQAREIQEAPKTPMATANNIEANKSELQKQIKPKKVMRKRTQRVTNRHPPTLDHQAEDHQAEVKLHNTIRVSVENIDRISALMEEMQVNKIAIDDYYVEVAKIIAKMKSSSEIWQQVYSQLKSKFGNTVGDNLQKLHQIGTTVFTTIAYDMQQLHKNLRTNINNLSIQSNSMQEEIRMLRLIPAANLLATLPRYIRDLSHELNKEVELSITGDEIKMDKMVLEKLKDPLIHLLRNSVDHGIESKEVRKAAGKSPVGHISLSIKEEGDQILISITDDGMGIDIKKISEIALKKNIVTKTELGNMTTNEIIGLIFEPGFTSKEIITSVSGRGVGLDVVKSNIANLNGSVSVKTKLNEGTTFELRLPLTVTSEHGLMVNVCGQSFVIPTNSIHRVLMIKVDELREIEGQQAIIVDKHSMPLYTLAGALGFEQKDFFNQQTLSVIVVKKEGESLAFVVDEIIGEREIVVKPLNTPLKNVQCVAGGTLSGSNQVIIVLDSSDLINSALHSDKTYRIKTQDKSVEMTERPHILVVDDSITTRTLEKNILESKNYVITVAVNGQEAWDLLQKEPFSLLITDVVMPIMDGFTLTERVKHSESLRDMPVIIVTSLGSEAEKIRGIEVGADAYVVKNEFESRALLDIVEQLV